MALSFVRNVWLQRSLVKDGWSRQYAACLLGRGVLSHSLGTLGHGVFSQFTR